MIRTTFSVMLGMVVAMMVMLGLEFVGAWWVPMPTGQLGNEADLAELVANAPTAKLAWVLTGWLLAAVCGGWVAARLARVRRMGAAIAVGVLIVLGPGFRELSLGHLGALVEAVYQAHLSEEIRIASVFAFQLVAHQGRVFPGFEAMLGRKKTQGPLGRAYLESVRLGLGCDALPA